MDYSSVDSTIRLLELVPPPYRFGGVLVCSLRECSRLRLRGHQTYPFLGTRHFTGSRAVVIVVNLDDTYPPPPPLGLPLVQRGVRHNLQYLAQYSQYPTQ